MLSDVFGRVWMCLDAFGCVRMPWGTFGRFRKFMEIFGFVCISLPFLNVFGRFQTCLDGFGGVWKCSDRFGGVPIHSDTFRLRIFRSDISKYDFVGIYF